MSIENILGRYILTCDYCGEQVDIFYDFWEAVEYQKANGWTASKIGVDWVSMCPQCDDDIHG